MIKALDPCTRGYLVSQFEVSRAVQQEVDWSRSWVAIDGSTMFTYRDEEVWKPWQPVNVHLWHLLQDEGVKECQHYIDLRGCNCELANIKGKPKGTIIRIQKPDGPSYLLQASDKVIWIVTCSSYYHVHFIAWGAAMDWCYTGCFNSRAVP